MSKVRDLFGAKDWVSHRRIVMSGESISDLEKNGFFSAEHVTAHVTMRRLTKTLTLDPIDERRKK